MCQPTRILKRNLTVPPMTEVGQKPRSSSAESKLHETKTKSLHSSGPNITEDNNCSISSPHLTYSTLAPPANESMKQNVGGLPNQRPNLRMSFFQLMPRRKSYESLDVIGGKARVPINRTPRQKLLKVN